MNLKQQPTFPEGPAHHAVACLPPKKALMTIYAVLVRKAALTEAAELKECSSSPEGHLPKATLQDTLPHQC